MNYKEILTNVINNGQPKAAVRFDSEGNAVPVENGTIGTFCEIFRHDMAEGFPLSGMRKLPFRSTCVELEGFIKGITSKKWYQDRKCGYWNEWANPKIVQKIIDEQWSPPYFDDTEGNNEDYNEFKKAVQKKEDDLGRIYGFVWRSFSTDDEIIEVNKKKTQYKLAEKEEVDIKELCVKIDKTKLSNLDKILYKNWYDMLNRCYNENCTQYEWYGAKNKKVCKLWLNFESYLQSIKTINNWVSKQRDPKKYVLDKDYYCSDHYAPDVCVFLSDNDNRSYNSSQCLIISNANESHKVLNFTQAAIIIGVTRRAVAMAFDENRMCNGWSIRKVGGVWRKRLPSDQLLDIVNKLKTNPYDRRMICSAWNPTILDQAALPSCHYSFTVVVYGNKLNLTWNQRSCDLILGVPQNIASYATLLLLLCKESGLEPGELVGKLEDCHIYDNLMPKALELNERDEPELPTVEIKSKDDGSFSIFEWEYSDIELTNYNPHSKINMGAVTV